MKNLCTFYVLGIEILMNLFLLLCYIKQRMKNNKQKETMKSLRTYNEVLNHLYDGMRGFKHDFVNFIQALEGYIQCDDMEGIRTMTSSVYTECKNVCNMEMLNPHMMNEPAIYNLLANKYQLACQNNITMNMDVNYPLSDLKMDRYYFCRILGILLDNAIEAVKLCDSKIINIRFLQEGQCQVVVVENTYQQCDINWDQIYEKGYTTKKDCKEHGIGLWKVKSMIDNFKNVEIKTNVGEMFSQELKMYAKKIA